jgi:hypothetical protein
MLNREQVAQLVLRRLALIGQELAKPDLVNADEQTRLFGQASQLDSIGLVTLIADLEQDLREATGQPVHLVNEKALSRLTSPFRRVGLLIDYITEILNPPA